MHHFNLKGTTRAPSFVLSILLPIWLCNTVFAADPVGLPPAPMMPQLKLDGMLDQLQRSATIAGATAIRKAELADALARKELLTAQIDIAKLEGTGGVPSATKPIVRAIVSKPDGTFRAWFVFADGQTVWSKIGTRLPAGGIVSEITDNEVQVTSAKLTQTFSLIFTGKRAQSLALGLASAGTGQPNNYPIATPVRRSDAQ